MGVLYKLTAPSGKSYIGITTKTLDERWAKHVEHACGKRTAGALYAALRKYGPNAFTREVLAASSEWAELCGLERDAIARMGTLAPKGYNVAGGGEGVIGKRDERCRAKIAEAQKRRFQNPEQRALLLENGRKAREISSEKWRVIREAARAERHADYATQEYKDLRSAKIKAGLARDGVRAKVLAQARRRAADPAWRAKQSAAKIGKSTGPCTEQRRRLISEARKREWADPVIRERRLAALAIARQAKQSKKEAA